MSDWIILRTSGRMTLKLAETLAEDGFEVWTPAEVKKVRIPRANVRRDVKLPIMPSYVFAKASHLIELLQLAKLEVKPRRGLGWGKPAHASFSVMRHSDMIPFISDAHLQALRTIEAKRAPKRKAERALPKGLQVRVSDQGGSFQGMSGTVERSDQGHTLVCFSGRYVVKIATFLLHEDDLRRDNVAARLAA